MGGMRYWFLNSFVLKVLCKSLFLKLIPFLFPIFAPLSIPYFLSRSYISLTLEHPYTYKAVLTGFNLRSTSRVIYVYMLSSHLPLLNT